MHQADRKISYIKNGEVKMVVKFTPIIQKAINVASEKHLGQERKADGLLYIVHPFTIAWLLSNYADFFFLFQNRLRMRYEARDMKKYQGRIWIIDFWRFNLILLFPISHGNRKDELNPNSGYLMK